MGKARLSTTSGEIKTRDYKFTETARNRRPQDRDFKTQGLPITKETKTQIWKVIY